MGLASFTSVLASITAYRSPAAPSPAPASASTALCQPSKPHPASTGFPRVDWNKGAFGVWPYRGSIDDKRHLSIAAHMASKVYINNFCHDSRNPPSRRQIRDHVRPEVYLLAVTDKALEIQLYYNAWGYPDSDRGKFDTLEEWFAAQPAIAATASQMAEEQEQRCGRQPPLPREDVEEWVVKALRGGFVGKTVRRKLSADDLPMSTDIMDVVRLVRLPQWFMKPYKNVTGNEYGAFSPGVAEALIGKTPVQPSLPSSLRQSSGTRSTSSGSANSAQTDSSGVPSLSSGDGSNPDDTFDSNAEVALIGGSEDVEEGRFCG